MLDRLRASALRALPLPMLLTFTLFLCACSQRQIDRIFERLIEALFIFMLIALVVVIISVVIFVLQVVVIAFNLTRPNRFTAIAGFVCGGFYLVGATAGFFNMIHAWVGASERVAPNLDGVVSALLGLVMMAGFGGVLIWSGWRGWTTIQEQRLALLDDDDL